MCCSTLTKSFLVGSRTRCRKLPSWICGTGLLRRSLSSSRNFSNARATRRRSVRRRNWCLKTTDCALDEFQIDIVYKRLLVNEYLPIINERPALLDAYRAGAICMVNSFRSKLIHKKALFAVLTDQRRAHLFTPCRAGSDSRACALDAAGARREERLLRQAKWICLNISRRTKKSWF